MEATTRVLDKTYIQNLLATNDKAVAQALLAIYSGQTDVEKNIGGTVEDNGIGYSGAHAEIMSSFAEWYKSKGFLTPKQVAISRNILPRYWKQLLTIAAGKGYAVTYKVSKAKKVNEA